MKNIFLMSLLISIWAVFFVQDVAYCLFRDDVDPQQAKSRMIIQREKSESATQQIQAKQIEKEAKRELTQQTQNNVSGTITSNNTPVFNAAKTQPQANTPSISAQEFKRFKREANQQYQPQAQKMPPTVAAPQSAEEPSRPMWPGVLLFILIIGAGMIWLKKKSE